MDAFLRFVTDPRYSAAWFVLALGTVYAVTPLLINLFVDQNPYMWKIGLLSGVAAICVVIGFLIPVVDFQFGPNGWRLPISFGVLHGAIWVVFAIFLIVTLTTAESIPLLSALKGGHTSVELEAQRGAFLKMRTGWEAGLGYVSAVLATALLPYSLAALFVRRASGRFSALSLFLFYVESHLQKALFIQMVTPLFYLTAQRKIWNYYALVALVLGSAGLLYLNTVLARGVRLDETAPGSGLGLAIVHRIALGYGGSLALGRAPLGGLRAALDLPAAPD